MNTNRLYYGDINEVEYKTRKYDYELFEGEEVIATLPLEEDYYVVKPYKKKVILVKYDKFTYVELAKLKTLKDLINVYFELLFEPHDAKYIVKDDWLINNKYIIHNTLEKYNGNLNQRESIKKLRKILLEKEK